MRKVYTNVVEKPEDNIIYTTRRPRRNIIMNLKEIVREDVDWRSQAADFFDTGIQKLIPRYEFLNSGGD
jgi:hypothetical protein